MCREAGACVTTKTLSLTLMRSSLRLAQQLRPHSPTGKARSDPAWPVAPLASVFLDRQQPPLHPSKPLHALLLQPLRLPLPAPVGVVALSALLAIAVQSGAVLSGVAVGRSSVQQLMCAVRLGLK